MTRLRALTALLATMLLLGALIPAGGAQETRDVTITMWTHDGLYVEFFSAQAEEWREQHPEINFTFDFQVVPQVFDVVLTNLAAGEEIPDMLGIEQGTFPRFMQDGIIESKFVDLTDLIGDAYDSIVPGRWTPYTYKGRIYGVDSSLSAVVYYYQPALFEERGLAIPTTWEEFLATGAVMAEDGVAMSGVLDHGGLFMMFLLQRGGEIFDGNGEFVLAGEANRQAAIDVLNFMRAGVDNGSLAVYVGGEFWGPSPITAYREGRLAGAIMPDWYSDYILKPQAEDMAGQWRIARMPMVGDGTSHKTSVWGGTGFGISRDSENVELVWDLLHYAYVTEENQLRRFEEISYYPTMPSAFLNERVTGLEDPFYGGQKPGEIYAQIVDDVPIWYQSLHRASFEEQMATELALLYAGEITPDEAIDNVIQFVEDEIAFGM